LCREHFLTSAQCCFASDPSVRHVRILLAGKRAAFSAELVTDRLPRHGADFGFNNVASQQMLRYNDIYLPPGL